MIYPVRVFRLPTGYFFMVNIFRKIAGGVSHRNRTRKYEWFVEQVALTSDARLLDVGYEGREYHSLSNSLEKLYPYPERITALGLPQDNREFRTRHPEVRIVTYDGGRFPFADKEFDAVWSNAVLEHVGNRESQVRFVSELLRVGKIAFFTTPNRYFPIEVHTLTPLLHWLPQKVFDIWVHLTGRPWADGKNIRLLSRKELESICHDAGASDMLVKKNRVGGFTMDWCVIVSRTTD